MNTLPGKVTLPESMDGGSGSIVSLGVACSVVGESDRQSRRRTAVTTAMQQLRVEAGFLTDYGLAAPTGASGLPVRNSMWATMTGTSRRRRFYRMRREHRAKQNTSRPLRMSSPTDCLSGELAGRIICRACPGVRGEGEENVPRRAHYSAR